jgi:hypothetical protein
MAWTGPRKRHDEANKLKTYTIVQPMAKSNAECASDYSGLTGRKSKPILYDHDGTH